MLASPAEINQIRNIVSLVDLVTAEDEAPETIVYGGNAANRRLPYSNDPYRWITPLGQTDTAPAHLRLRLRRAPNQPSRSLHRSTARTPGPESAACGSGRRPTNPARSLHRSTAVDKPFGTPMVHTVTGSGYCIRAAGEAAPD